MIFQEPPKISKKKLDKMGMILISPNSSDLDLQLARLLLNQWRACHAYPINTFQSTLRTKVRNGKYGASPIIAQRLKRTPTILEKLREGAGEESGIRLTNMQDIAGVRAILSSVEDVYRLHDEYKEKGRFKHEFKKCNDYIKTPKPKNGYRSIHLVYRYKNILNPAWDDLIVELQIRTKLQHSWATAVEALHTFLGKAIKTRKAPGQTQWTEFFRLVSSAFAYMENTPVVSSHQNMTPEEIWSKLQHYERDLKVRDKLAALPVAMDAIQAKKNSKKVSSYHLIVLNTIERKVSVTNFSFKQFQKANEEYAAIEQKSLKKPGVEAVLVSANEVEKAYPSFFSDTKDFNVNLLRALEGKWINRAKSRKIRSANNTASLTQ